MRLTRYREVGCWTSCISPDFSYSFIRGQELAKKQQVMQMSQFLLMAIGLISQHVVLSQSLIPEVKEGIPEGEGGTPMRVMAAELYRHTCTIYSYVVHNHWFMDGD